METWAGPLKDYFYRRTCKTKEEGVTCFYKVWADLDPNKINKTIKGYPRRLVECRDITKGKATKF
jgi:hypothetical protein